jgi:predicted deacylase
MASAAFRLTYPLDRLKPGFHRHRFTARGVGFEAFIWRGLQPGPVLLVNGATHGDEYEGPTLLRQWAETWRPTNLRGTVILVPVLNEGAFLAGARCDPADGRNLAREFPGRANGSVTQRLAHLFDTQLLAQATHYADLHSAGHAYELLPWSGYITRPDAGDRVQRAMAACFDSFWCWAGPFLPGRTLSAAYDRGIPAIYVECQGKGGVETEDLRALERGLNALLRQVGNLPVPRAGLKLRRQRLRITKDTEEAHLQVHHPAPHAGLFVPTAMLGAWVKRGQGIGRVQRLDTTQSTIVRATSTGRVVMHRRQRSVLAGDALYTLAPV